MEKLFIIICLLMTCFSYSQPGEDHFSRERIRKINMLTDSLAKNPKNFELVWERTEEIFRPFFSMYTRPLTESEKNDSVKVGLAYSGHNALKYKGIDVLEELNKLIQHADLLKPKPENAGNNKTLSYVNKSNFYHKRGQYHYLNGEKNKAIEDYLNALNYNPDSDTKKSICIALAAYYYMFDVEFEPSIRETHTQSNLLKALEYMDMISPQFDKEIQDLSSDKYKHYQGSEVFEQEKLNLLEMTNQTMRLANFHINKTVSLFNFYNKLIDESKAGKTNNSDQIKKILGFAIKSLSESEKYLALKKIDFKILTE